MLCYPLLLFGEASSSEPVWAGKVNLILWKTFFFLTSFSLWNYDNRFAVKVPFKTRFYTLLTGKINLILKEEYVSMKAFRLVQF